MRLRACLGLAMAALVSGCVAPSIPETTPAPPEAPLARVEWLGCQAIEAVHAVERDVAAAGLPPGVPLRYDGLVQTVTTRWLACDQVVLGTQRVLDDVSLLSSLVRVDLGSPRDDDAWVLEMWTGSTELADALQARGVPILLAPVELDQGDFVVEASGGDGASYHLQGVGPRGEPVEQHAGGTWHFTDALAARAQLVLQQAPASSGLLAAGPDSFRHGSTLQPAPATIFVSQATRHVWDLEPQP